MQQSVRRLGLAGTLVLLLATSGAGLAKPPDEKALKDYGSALQELTNVLRRVVDVPSANASVPAIKAQVDRIVALGAQLTTQAEGNPTEKPKKEQEQKSTEMKQYSGLIRTASDRLGQEMLRVLSNPDVAKIVEPALSKLAEPGK